ncbi:hypothetical protein FRB90_004526 [Tulasnella sp. 427]|nr:hypothetical protein FRB90_004526 [Tulasnella sp. 427]
MNQNTSSIPNTVRLPFEIIDHILSFASRRALFNCLVTCKAYSDLAKSHLWRHLETAIPLFDLLGPTNYTALVGCPKVSWNFNRKPLASQWETFAHYARLVKTIAPNASTDPDSWLIKGTTDRIWPEAECESYMALHRDWQRNGHRDLQRDMPFDPSISVGALQTLHSIPIEFAGDQVLRSIPNLTPNLEHLDFVFVDVKATSPWAFVPFLGPKLRSLSLRFRVGGIDTAPVAACMIGSFRALARALSFPQSTIESLRTLEIRTVRSGAFPFRSSEVDAAFLELLSHCSTVRELHYTPRLIQHDAFLSTIQNHLPNLASLSVCIDDPSNLASFASRLALVRPEIEELHLSHQCGRPTALSTLKSLLAFRNLRSLSLFEAPSCIFDSSTSAPQMWVLTPDLLAQLSAAWPNLRRLSLKPNESVDVTSFAAFRDEKLFGELEELTIALKADRLYHNGAVVQQVDEKVIRPLRSLKMLSMRTPPEYGGLPPAMWVLFLRYLGPSGMKIFNNGNRQI